MEIKYNQSIGGTYQTVRIFISSTFRDMQAERDHLIRFVFPRLREELLTRRIHLVDVDLRWGVTSDQDALSVCREVVDDCRPYFLCMLGGRYGWIPPGQSRSITADEIHYAILDRLDDRGFAHFYFRDPTTTASMLEEQMGEYREPPGSAGEHQLEGLKKAIDDTGFEPFTYSAQWDYETRRLIGLKEFGDRVYADLKKSIEDQFGKQPAEKLDEFAEENAAMRSFIEEHAHSFVLGSRERIWKDMIEYINGVGKNYYLCLVGQPGTGKTALLANLSKHLLGNTSDSSLIIPYFIGAGTGSTDAYRILRHLCHELIMDIGLALEIPDDPEKLLGTFTEALEKACAQKQVVILVDAVDRLDYAPQLFSLWWLPEELPDQARIIISSPPSLTLDQIRQRRNAPREVVLSDLSQVDAETIIHEFLERYHKHMSNEQLMTLLNKTDSRTPLYLLAVLEELRTLGTYEEITDRIRQLPPTTPALFDWILQRLEEDDGFRDASGRTIGKRLLRQFTSLIAVSRHGLSERELVELSAIDEAETGAFIQEDIQGNVAGLVQLLRPYLMNRSEMLDFYHNQFRAAVHARYIQTSTKQSKFHTTLAEYFYAKGYWQIPQEARVTESTAPPTTPRLANVRTVDELPWQLLQAEKFHLLTAVITSLEFIEAKCTAGMTYDLIADYRTALAANGLEEKHRGVIEEFASFMLEQSYILVSRPDLTFQQAANERIDTSPAKVARQQIESGKEVRPWLRLISGASTDSVCLLTFAEHTAAVLSSAVSPDGQRAVSGDQAGFLKWWDPASGSRLYSLRAHKDAITACAFSPDGRRLVSASRDKTLKIWNAENASLLKTLSGHESPIKACAYSPNGERLFSCSEDCVKVWDLTAAEELAPLVVNKKGLLYSLLSVPEAAGAVIHESSLESIALSADGQWAATSSCWVGTVKIWNLLAGTEQTTLGGDSDSREWHGKPVLTCVFSPDSKSLASSSDTELILWDWETGSKRLTLSGHKRSVSACAFSPDGSYIVSASNDGTLKLWRTGDGSLIRTMAGHLSRVTSCVFYSDGMRIISSSEDGTVKVWDVSEVRNAGHDERDRLWIKALSQYGPLLVTSEHRSNSQAILLDDEASLEGRPLRGRLTGEFSASFSSDGKQLVTADARALRLWDFATGKAIATFTGDLAERSWCMFSPDGNRVLTGTTQRSYVYEFATTELKLWDVSAKRELASLVAPYDRNESISHPHFACFTSDSALVVATVPGNALKVWDAVTGQEKNKMRVHRAQMRSCLLSPDGSKILIFSTSDDNKPTRTKLRGSLRLWDPTTGKILAEWSAHDDNDMHSIFSPDGNQIVTWETVVGKSRITLWEAQTGRKLRTIGTSEHIIRKIFFSPDGQKLVSCPDDIFGEIGTISLWNPQGAGELVKLSGKPFGFSPDGKRFLTVDYGTLKIWDVETGTELARYISHLGVRAASWSPDGRRVFAHLPKQASWFLPGETLADRVDLLQLENIEVYPISATTWGNPGSKQDE